MTPDESPWNVARRLIVVDVRIDASNDISRNVNHSEPCTAALLFDKIVLTLIQSTIHQHRKINTIIFRYLLDRKLIVLSLF